MIDQIGQSIYEFVSPVFIIVFMLSAFLINKAVKSKRFLKKIKPRIRSFWRTLVIGIILAGVFFWLEGDHTGHAVLMYLVSIFLSMAFLWGGIEEWLVNTKGKIKDLKDAVKTKEDNDDRS